MKKREELSHTTEGEEVGAERVGVEGDSMLCAECVKLGMPAGQLLNQTQLLDVSTSHKAQGLWSAYAGLMNPKC